MRFPSRRVARLPVLALAATALASSLVAPALAESSVVAVTSSGSDGPRTAITLDRPAGTQAGHVLLAAIVNNDNDEISGPAGWSVVRDDAITDALRQKIYVKVATASEPSSYTWTVPNWRRLAGGLTAYAGIDTTNPVDGDAGTVHGSASTSVTAPSVTTTVAGARTVMFAAVNAEGTLQPPSDMTERWEAASPNSSNTRDVVAASSDAVQAAAGATGSRTATASAAGRSIGALVALRPSDAPPPADDTTPPDTTITSGPSGTVESRSATFTFTATETATFDCRLDSAPFTSCTSPRTYTGLADGGHRFEVQATDTAGNPDPDPAERLWTVAGSGSLGGIIGTVAGTGTNGFSGDGGPAASARLAAPRTMATDPAGNIFFVDTDNHRVRRVDAATGVITTIAGTGTAGYSGDGGPATSARLNTPHGIDVDDAGRVFVADAPNHRIRRIGTDGVITTVAGTGTAGYNGDGISATAARLRYPKGVEIGPDGLLYIADANNHRVRRVSATGVISTVAGTGSAGFSGDGGPAVSARLNTPRNLAFDGDGTMYIADDQNYRVRRVTPSGTITTVAGTGAAGFSGDGGPATSARLRRVRDVARDGAGNLYIADEQNNRIRRVSPSGTMSTFAGTGTAGDSGDGGAAVDAKISGPRGVAVDPGGRILIADTGNHRLRRVS